MGLAQASPADEGQAQAPAVDAGPLRNVLFAGDFWHGASERAIAQGLRNLGRNVQEVALLDHFLRSPSLAMRLAGRLLTPFSRRAYNAEIVRAAGTIGDGLFMTVRGSYVVAETLAALRAMGVKSALYYPDVDFEDAVDLDAVRDFDLVFTTKSYHAAFLDRLRGPGRSFHVSHGYSPAVHRPHRERVGEEDYLYDVVFVGNADRHKADWLAQLRRAIPDRRMAIVGERWDLFAPGTALETCHLTGRIAGDLMAEIVQRSRINVAVHAWPESPHGWRDTVSTRTFEIPACKGFMLHEDNGEVRTLFDVGAEIDVFGDAADLSAKVIHYLDEPDRRAAMIERAYRRAVPAYSYYERAREISAIVGRELGG